MSEDEDAIESLSKAEEHAEIFNETRPPEVVEPSQLEKSDGRDPLVDRALQDFITRGVLPRSDLIPSVLQLLEKNRVEALMDGDYDTAEEQDKIASTLQSLAQAEQQKDSEERVINVLFQRWQKLQQQQMQVLSKWEREISTFLLEIEQQERNLAEKQDREIDEFLEQWKDPGFVRQFGKPSPQLLHLRDQEKAMAVNRRYGEAREIKSFADKLQKEETEAAQSKITAQMAIEREKLGLKHAKEMEALKMYKERMLQGMENEKAKELRPIQTALSQIKAKKHPPSRLPKLSSSKGVRKASSSLPYSPRTQTRYSQFRSEKKATLLDIVPVSDSQLQGMKSRHRVSRSKPGLTTRTVQPVPGKRFTSSRLSSHC